MEPLEQARDRDRCGTLGVLPNLRKIKPSETPSEICTPSPCRTDTRIDSAYPAGPLRLCSAAPSFASARCQLCLLDQLNVIRFPQRNSASALCSERVSVSMRVNRFLRRS